MTTGHSSSDDTNRQAVRQLKHDVQSHLLVLRMGLGLLEDEKTKPSQYGELVEMIRREGLEPLETAVSGLINYASDQSENS